VPTSPLATYRLQLHPGFDFDAAAAVAGYLADLGVTHAYLSPVLQAAPGSTHGYDVVDHSRPSAALGGEAGHARLAAAMGAAGLGQVLDIVPNHMAIGSAENRWWWDVLENGPSSLWAGHFDVSWDPPEEKLRNTVLMPILGDHYGRVLDRGEVRLEHERGEFTIRYHDHVLPVALRTLARHIADAAERAGSDDLAFVADALRRLPAATRTDRASMVERHRDTAVLRRQLAWLLRNDTLAAAQAGSAGPLEPGEAVRTAVAAVVDEVNADVDALDALLEDQNYRIAFWRTAGRELGYRRFFDINSLVGVRVEDPEVFDDTHGLLLRWVREGVIDGLRVDHPDGLRDPEQYFERLAALTQGAWVVAEKILEVGEELPTSWPVAGTTGYDRLAVIDGVLVDPAGEAPLTTAYGALTGSPTRWPEVQHEAKALAVREILAADVSRLTAQLMAVCEGRRHQRDRTRHELAEALRELLTSFPVYRTYVRAGRPDREVQPVRPADVAHVEAAVADVAARRPDVDPDLLAFLADLLLARLPDAGPLEHDLTMQFQQLSGPAMAKGVEDTAFYRYTRLLALNEVGGDPGRFGVPVDDFHAAHRQIHERWPATMTTLSTHDTKRSADVRARLAVLSEVPGAWAAFAERWMAASAPHWPGEPDRPTQWLLLQSLVGAWPLDAERATAYLAKATKEAKVRTTWTEPDADFDAARDGYVAAVLADPALVAEVEAFVATIAPAGYVNGLAQQLLALTVPGVPDVYQGNELVDLSLVDPDNRRPVDFDRRRALLATLPDLSAEELLERTDEGLPKLKVTHAALHLRRRRPASFRAGAAGAYRPLPVAGPGAEHVVAFTRGDDVAVVVPRLVLRRQDRDPGAEAAAAPPAHPAAGRWADTVVGLPPGTWIDLLTGARWPVAPDAAPPPAPAGGTATGGAGGWVRVDDLLDRFPVALLERVG
jgi:(1->4)-alpha-D-glucan 1-alpha-D-glucosylmutase